MSQVFLIKISAQDKASDVAKKISRSLLDLGTEADKASSRGGGFGAWSASLGKVSSAAVDAGRSIMSLASRGTLAAGAFTAALGLLGRSAGNNATSLQYMAARIGISVQELNTFRGAMRVAGLETGDADSSLSSFAATLNKVAAGSSDSIEAADTLRALGVTIKRNAAGTIDTLATLEAAIDAIAKKRNPQTQAIAADILGIGSIFPIIQRGTGELDRLRAAARESGSEIGDSFVEAAKKIDEAFGKLGVKFDNLKLRGAGALEPWIRVGENLLNRVFGAIDEGKFEQLARISERIAGSIGRVAESGLPSLAGRALGLLDRWTGGGTPEPQQTASQGPAPRKPWSGADADGLNYTQRWKLGLGQDPRDMPRDQPMMEMKRLERKYPILPPGLLDGVWSAESNRSDPRFMRSHVGAEGPFQFMPATQREYGLRNPYDFNESADAAARKLSNLMRWSGGDVRKALAAWNYGEGNVNRVGMDNLPRETREFVGKVTRQSGLAQTASGTIGPAPVGTGTGTGAGAAPAATPAAGEIRVIFEGAPAGTRAKVTQSEGVQLRVGVAPMGAY